MALSATTESVTVPNGKEYVEDPTIASLRAALGSESTPLARRFRALFALKHHACFNPPTAQTIPAIHAIAAAFSTPSSLLKHELAYCLGQTRNMNAAQYLRERLEDEGEDDICRHEAAEALAALGDVASVPLLRRLRDDPAEAEVVRETCDIAVDKLEWEASKAKEKEELRPR
jgi:deoxyhypusine monooxygenase